MLNAKGRLVVTAVMVLAGMLSARAFEAYECMFWDDLRDWNTPRLIDETACHTALPYNPLLPDNATLNGVYPPPYTTRAEWLAGGWTRDKWVKTYLDAAQARGMTVILSCAELLKEEKNQPTVYSWADFTQYVKTFKDHPAVKGWYLADEPTDNSLLEACKTGHNIIRKICGSTKPIYMAFEYQALVPKMAAVYQDTYDIMMFDHYICVTGEPEFNRFATWAGHPYPGWKEYCTEAMAQASALGKPFINILQAQGRDEASSNYRLPTYNEARFMTFWSVLKGSAGVSFWAMDQLINETKAYPGDLYPANGATWQIAVAKPICQELEKLKYALGAGPVLNGVTGKTASLLSKIYRDPATGKYYLLTVNDSVSAVAAVTLSITVPGHWSQLAEYGGGSVPVVGNQVLLGSYAKYQVRNFELVPRPKLTLTESVGAYFRGLARDVRARFRTP